MEKECEACGIIFVTENKLKKYCDRCGKNGHGLQNKTSYDNASIRTHKYDIREPTIYSIECEECNKSIKGTARTQDKYRYRVNGEMHYFCGEDCFVNYRKAHRYCYQCNKHLDNPIIIGWTNDMCFCSEECRNKYAKDRKLLRKCEHCGKQFIRKTGWFCSKECSRVARKTGWIRPEPKFEDDWF